MKYILAGLLILVLTAPTSARQSSPHGPGHDRGHDLYHDEFYSKLMRPDTGTSCCNNQDCKPVSHRVTPDGVEFFVNDTWLPMPASRTIETVTPDGGAHWCGSPYVAPGATPITYCAILPFTGN